MLRQALVLFGLVFGLGACAMPEEHPAWRPPAALRPIATRIDPAIQRAVDENIARLVAEKKIPGLAVAVARDDAIVAYGQAGRRVAGSGAAIGPEDLFHIGSVAKPMTATLIATFVEEGRIGWEKPLRELFPGWTIHPALRDATLEQVMAHRAGTAPFTGLGEWTRRGVPPLAGSNAEKRLQFVRWLLAQPPDFPAGSFHYSNADYSIAAAAVERIAGRPWEELIRERLFEPLGMTSARFGWPRDFGPDEPWGHWDRDGRYVPHGPNDPYKLAPEIAPGGDVSMTMRDLARFAAAHLAGLRGEDGLVQAATVRRMHRPLTGAEPLPYGEYGLGWFDDPALLGEPLSRVDGNTGIFRAHIWLLPERNLALVAAGNADTKDVASAISILFQRIRRAAIAATPPAAAAAAAGVAPLSRRSGAAWH